MAITNGYATVAQLSARLAPSGTTFSATEQANQETAIAAASRLIDAHTGRRHGFWQDATVKTRQFYADNSRVCYVDDISTTTGLVVTVDTAQNGFASGTTVLTETTDFVLRPINAADETPVWPYNEIVLTDTASAWFPTNCARPGVQVVAKFGWPAVPDDVTQACLIEAVELYNVIAANVGGELGSSSLLSGRGLNPVAAALVEVFVVQ